MQSSGTTVFVCLAALCALSYAESADSSESEPVVAKMGSSKEVDIFYAGHYEPDPFVKVDEVLVELADSIGFAVDQIRTIGCLLIAFPIAFIHRLLPDSPTLKHLYSIFWGFFFSWLCFGINTFVPLFVALVTYVGAFILPTKVYPVVIFVFAMGVLTFMHIYRLIIDFGGYSLDITGPLMIVTLKSISFAWNVHDFKCLDNLKPMYASRKARAIDINNTSILEFLGYMFYFGGYLAGPTFEVADYIAFTKLTMYKSDKDGRPSIGASLLPVLTQILIAFASCGFFVAIAGTYFPVSNLFTTEFLSYSVPYRMLISTITIASSRPKYYFVWFLANGAIILSGLGYNGRGKDGSVQWNRCANANIISVEMGQSTHEVMGNWNCSVNKWLRFYVYERAQEFGLSKGMSTIATFGVSGFWHGFYVGYYMTFFMGALMTNFARQMRGALRPLFENTETRKTPFWYNMVGMLITQVMLDAFAVPFVMLTYNESIQVYKNLAFAPFGIALVIVVLIKLLQSQAWHKKAVAEYKKKTSKKSK